MQAFFIGSITTIFTGKALEMQPEILQKNVNEIKIADSFNFNQKTSIQWPFNKFNTLSSILWALSDRYIKCQIDFSHFEENINTF